MQEVQFRSHACKHNRIMKYFIILVFSIALSSSLLRSAFGKLTEISVKNAYKDGRQAAIVCASYQENTLVKFIKSDLLANGGTLRWSVEKEANITTSHICRTNPIVGDGQKPPAVAYVVFEGSWELIDEIRTKQYDWIMGDEGLFRTLHSHGGTRVFAQVLQEPPQKKNKRNSR